MLFSDLDLGKADCRVVGRTFLRALTRSLVTFCSRVSVGRSGTESNSSSVMYKTQTFTVFYLYDA